MSHCDKIMNNLYLGDAEFIFVDQMPKFDLIINCCPEINISYSNKYQDTKIIRLMFNDDSNDNNKLITVSCKIFIGQYPFDEQTCVFDFLSWSYPINESCVKQFVNGNKHNVF